MTARKRAAWLYRKAVGLVAPLAVGLLVWLALTTLQARHDQTRALNTLGRVANNQNTQISDQTRTISGLQGNIAGLTGQITSLTQTASDQTARIADLQNQLTAALTRQAQLTALVTAEYRQLLARPPTVVMVPAPGPSPTAKPGTTTTTTTTRPPTHVTVPPCGQLLHEIGLC